MPSSEEDLQAQNSSLLATFAAALTKKRYLFPPKEESQKSEEELAQEREKILQEINKRIRELIREIAEKYFYLEKKESLRKHVWRKLHGFLNEFLKGKPKRDVMDKARAKEEQKRNLTREQVARIHLFNKIESAASLLGIFPAVDQILEKLLGELHINILKTADLYPKEKRKEQIQHLRLQSLIASLGVILETVQGFDENIQAIYGDIIEKKSDLKQTWDKIMAVLIAGLIGNYGFHTSDICNLQVSCDHLDETQLEIAKKLGLSIEKGFISSTDYKKVLQEQSEIGEEVDWKHLLETPLLTEYLNSLEMEEARHGKDGSNRENIILIKELLLLIEKYADPLATTYARRGLDARNCNVEDLIKELPGVKKLMKKLEL